MLKEFKPRLYQETIVNTCVNSNTLVVIPTGMGQTAIAVMLTSHRLKNYPNSKILFLAPTRPLVQQHLDTFRLMTQIGEEDMSVFTGFVKPEKRAELWQRSKIIFSTPQGLENDIISRRIRLEEVSLLIFDEAHRATGDYAYNFIAQRYHKEAQFPRILALTASPGSDVETIKEVCTNLFIEDVEIRTPADPDMKPYIQDVKINWVEVDLPESFIQIKKALEECYSSKLKEIKGYGYLDSAYNNGKTDMLQLQRKLHSEISHGEKSFEILKSVSLLAEAMKVQHALELIETQGVSPLYHYFEKLQSEAVKTNVKAVKNLVQDANFKSAFLRTSSMYDAGVEHPKLARLSQLVTKDLQTKGAKMIIFTQFRDTAVKICEKLKEIEGALPKIFVGQAKKGDTGLSQKQQKEMLDQFRAGDFNILIATSVAEEGLDIPKVDSVIFYEPIPSTIRTIQRRGRTGRLEKGAVTVLVAKNTRDVGYRWSAHHKENRMYRTLADMKHKIRSLLPQREVLKDNPLSKYVDQAPEIRIFADDREKGNKIIKELIGQGVSLTLQRIDVGDYIVSRRCAAEYKTVQDFVDSIIDGRLLHQVKELKQNYERPVIVLEGTEDLYSQRNIHPNAIRGMIATITVSYGIPIIRTKDNAETSAILVSIAKREQEENGKEFSLHGSKKPMGVKEQQEYIISSLPGVGPGLAKPLLGRFKSVKNVVNASEEELKEVGKIGEKKAKEIREIVEKEYKD